MTRAADTKGREAGIETSQKGFRLKKSSSTRMTIPGKKESKDGGGREERVVTSREERSEEANRVSNTIDATPHACNKAHLRGAVN